MTVPRDPLEQATHTGSTLAGVPLWVHNPGALESVNVRSVESRKKLVGRR
ncbi:MAG: hypothetical protein ACKO8I_07135 [Cyanobacteriota bacterium]